jgi:hypothetical protein
MVAVVVVVRVKIVVVMAGAHLNHPVCIPHLPQRHFVSRFECYLSVARREVRCGPRGEHLVLELWRQRCERRKNTVFGHLCFDDVDSAPHDGHFELQSSRQVSFSQPSSNLGHPVPVAPCALFVRGRWKESGHGAMRANRADCGEREQEHGRVWKRLSPYVHNHVACCQSTAVRHRNERTS